MEGECIGTYQISQERLQGGDSFITKGEGIFKLLHVKWISKNLPESRKSEWREIKTLLVRCVTYHVEENMICVPRERSWAPNWHSSPSHLFWVQLFQPTGFLLSGTPFGRQESVSARVAISTGYNSVSKELCLYLLIWYVYLSYQTKFWE